MSKLLRQKFHKNSAFDEKEDLNPMTYTGNLSDAMLVLAVGIMLALVLAFNVDISESSNENADSENIEEFKATADEEGIPIEDLDLKEYGKVYIDQDGNLYVIEDGS